MSLKEKYISIESVDDLTRCINLASLLEVSGHPKPGNIHRTHDYQDTRYEHFLAGIAAILPNFRELCERAHDELNVNNDNYSFVQLGQFYKQASVEMMKWQKGGNVLLGHILIIAPLAAAAAICMRRHELSFSKYVNTLHKIIEDATVEDTIQLYDAIRTCNPGGLGKIDKYDLNDTNSQKAIRTDNMTLKKIFEISAGYDLIALEYSKGFKIVLTEGLPHYFRELNQTNDINVATVNTFLTLLSQYPDTLIIRKASLEKALIIKEKAKKIVRVGGITSKRGMTLTRKLDKFMQEKNGSLNPGTTADLIAGVIFCALLFGVNF